jgi:hypothetical protein
MKHIVLIAILCAAAGGVLAQPSEPKLPEVAENASPTAAIGGPGAQVTASNTDSNVSLKVSYRTSLIPASSTSGTVPNGGAFTTFSLTATAPLGQGEQSQALFSDGGLGKANSIGLSAFHFMTDFRNQSADENSALANLCEQMKAKAQKNKVGSPQLTPEEAGKLECSKANLTKYAPEDLATAERVRAGPLPGGWGIGLTGKVGQSDSTYYDPTLLSKSTRQSHPWSLGVVGSYMFPSNQSMVSVGVDRRRVFKDQPTSTRCPADSPFTPVQCVTGSFGPPSETSSSVLTLEGRTILSEDLALSLSVARDTTRKITAVELPVYLTKNSSGGLTGGVKLNWNNDDRKAILGVFVGIPFTVWK